MIYGITVDNVQSPDVICAALKALPKRPTVRIVFDPGMDPSDYEFAVTRIGTVADIMASPVDSSWAARIDLEAYTKRFMDYYHTLSHLVDIWEVGNEINGDWQASDIALRVKNVNGLIKALGGKTHLCFYGADNLQSFTNDALTTDTFHPTDFTSVGISYYEQDNDWKEYNWTGNLNELSTKFTGDIVISECGVAQKAKKAKLLNHYYGNQWNSLLAQVPRFKGGGYWWYGRNDFMYPGKFFHKEFSECLSKI